MSLFNRLHRTPVCIWAPRSISIARGLEYSPILSMPSFMHYSVGNIARGVDLRQLAAVFDATFSTGSRSLRTVSPAPRSFQDLFPRSAISNGYPGGCRSKAGDSPLRAPATQSRLSDSEVHPRPDHNRTRIPLEKELLSRFNTTHSHIVSSSSNLTFPLTSSSLIHACFKVCADLGCGRELI